MSTDQPASGDDETRLSWRDRELLTALRRLANSQAQVQALEAALELQRGVHVPDPADVDRIETLESELAKLRAKAGSRFGGGAARDRLPEVEAEQRAVLERLGFHTYAEFRSAGGLAVPVADPVDPAFVDFARRELADAEQAYEQLLSMPDDIDESPAAPLAKPPETRHEEPPGHADYSPTIDLRRWEK
jgi:hypothetical protein